jgi:hypothetical protein
MVVRAWRGIPSVLTVPNQVLVWGQQARTHGRPPQEQRGPFLKSAGPDHRRSRRPSPSRGLAQRGAAAHS